MGTIRIGQGEKKVFFYPGAVPVIPGAQKKREYTPEEKEKLLESIKMMPKSKWVSALRSAGLTDEAAECERGIAEELRSNRRNEILTIADDKKRLKALIAEGFDDDAKVLAESLAQADIQAKAPVIPAASEEEEVATNGDPAVISPSPENDDAIIPDGDKEPLEKDAAEDPLPAAVADAEKEEEAGDGGLAPVEAEKKKAGRPKKS